MATANWKIRLVDRNLAPGTDGREQIFGDFVIDTMPNTKLTLGGPATEAVELSERAKFSATGEDRNAVPDAEAGFVFTDGRFDPVTGWVAYAKETCRDELMAGRPHHSQGDALGVIVAPCQRTSGKIQHAQKTT